MRAAHAAAILLATSTITLAQSTLRLKGLVHDEAGAPVDGSKVKTEAIWGFRGSDQFAGQSTFNTKADKNGEWSLLGLTSGIWLFVVDAPNQLPQAFVLPVKMMSREAGSGGTLLPWPVEFTVVAPIETLAPLAAAVKPAFAGKKAEVFQILTPALESQDPKFLVAAGEILLIVKEPVNAEKIFNRALVVDGQNWRAHFGLGSAALMNRNWNAAVKSMWTARELAPAAYKQAISAAISDLQQITNTQ